MKRLVALTALLLLLPLCGSRANVTGTGDKGQLYMQRLSALVPSAFLDFPVPVTVEAMSPEDMAAEFGSSNVLAFYTNDRHIYIRSDLRGYDLDVVLVHEFGHYVSFNILGFREKQTWVSMWKAGKYRSDEYRSTSAEEGFAEAFAFYYCNDFNDAHKNESEFVKNIEKRVAYWLPTVPR